MKQTFTPFQTALTGTALFLALLLNIQGLFANNTVLVKDLLNENGKLHNPLQLSGTVDFSGFQVILDECEGPLFLPAPPVAPGWNALGAGLNSFVQDIAISGSDVYVGGNFLDAGGNADADYIARWDGSTWNALGPGLNDRVSAIAISGSDVYVGGGFTDAGGNAAADLIARWNGSTWNALGSGLIGSVVYAIALSGSDVYVGGAFGNAGGNAAADYIARWNGSTWNALGSGLIGNVNAIAISGSDVYVGGDFLDAGGNTAADRIARWNGSTWNALGSGVSSTVRAIALSGSDVYVGGDFQNAGGNAAADRIARWNGSTWNALGAGVFSNVWAIAISGSDVYVGGEFIDAGGNAAADRIARWDGSAWNALGTGVTNTVYAIALSGSDVYVGGVFTDAGGNADADRIARWGETALPVELIDFLAAAQAPRTTLLSWRTASEQNNQGFDIERSTDGRTWQPLGFVPGQGTTQQPRVYTFVDERPLPGINYYRLRQVDFDGKFEYSGIRSVAMEGSSQGVQVYPNPVQGGGLLSIHFATEQDAAATLRIFDASGKMLHRETLANQYNQTGYGQLPAGIYFIEVTSDYEVWRERLAVQ